LVSESAVLDDQIASLRHKIEEERQKELEMMRKKAEYFANKSTCLKEKQHELAVVLLEGLRFNIVLLLT
jgi:hypothetical protein